MSAGPLFGKKKSMRPPFEVRPIASSLGSYSAETDPYCPYTRTEAFQSFTGAPRSKMVESRGFLSMDSPSNFGSVSDTMKYMERTRLAPTEKFPKHSVMGTTFGSSVGITFSAEESSNFSESHAELEVLKAILNREGYLSRLQDMSRTVSRKFKPEISDVIDLVRAATIDVVDAVVKWREAKV
jgi:hypothetical protein